MHRIPRRAALAVLLTLATACGVASSRRVRAFVNDDNPVIVYGASWCPHTAAALSWLQQHRVAYVMRDVDGSSTQRDEMDAKVSRAGLTRTGIPVMDVHGTILVGFDASLLGRALDAAEPGH